MGVERLVGSAVAAVAFSLGLAASAVAAEYKLVDLGVAPGASNSTALAVNNQGQVIGYNSTYGNSSYFFWSASTGQIQYTGSGVLKALNNNGQVLLYDLSNYALWSPGTNAKIAITSGYNTRIVALNDAGGFAGSVTGRSADDAAAWLGGTPLSGTSPVVISPLGGYVSPGNEAVAINNAGSFVGNIYVGNHADWHDDKLHPFLWTAGQGFVDLGSLSSVNGNTVATGMNDSGTTVGYGVQLGTSRVRSFIWTQAGGMQDIGSPFPSTGVSWFDDNNAIRALDVNNAGTVIGYAVPYSNSAPSAFIWSAATGNTFLDAQLTGEARQAGWHVSWAGSINDAGWIAGSAVVNGVTHAVVLVPVPEPATWACLLTGGLLLAAVRRKGRGATVAEG